MITFGSLFSGIGGMDLGLERAGMACKWQVEIDDYCQRVLNKHWPKVEKFREVRNVGKENLQTIDLIAGGFPCQPHSVAGKQRGAADDRNLWPEYLRIIKELQPRYVLGENVPGIITIYIDTVLSDLENEGYTCTTLNIPAMAFDAPHRRERIFIVAWDTTGDRGSTKREIQGGEDANTRGICEDVADTERTGQQSGTLGQREIQSWGSNTRIREYERTWWSVEPDVGRVAHGIPSGVDRLRGLGNAVVPQVAEWIGERIIEFEKQAK